MSERQWTVVRAVLAFPIAAAAELAFLQVTSELLPGGSSNSEGDVWMVVALAPFIMGSLVIWHVVLGFVLGAIFRTTPALLGVGAGVLLGGALYSVGKVSEPNLGTLAIIAFFVLIFLLPGYLVAARIRARSGGSRARRMLALLVPIVLVPGLGILAALGMLNAGGPPPYYGPFRPAVPADQTQTVTVTGTSISVEPAVLTPGSVDVELIWPDYATAYRLHVVGPLESPDELRLGDGDIGWWFDYFGQTSRSVTTGSYQTYGDDADLSGYLGRLALRLPGRYAWLAIETVPGPSGREAQGQTYELRMWTVFSVE